MAAKPKKPVAPVATATTTPGTDYLKYLPGILFAFCMLLYINSLLFGYVLDDEAVISKNHFVQKGLAGIPDILTTFYWQGYWNSNSGLFRPLSLIVLAIEWHLNPDTPFFYHLVNVLLYATSIVLLYRFLVKLLHQYTPLLSFCIVLLFATHPMHTEVVANIKSLDEILCFLFFVLAANSLISNKNIVYTIIYFFLALLSKEAAVLFIPVLTLILIQFYNNTIKDVAHKLWPLLVVTGIWLAWRYYVLAHGPAMVAYTYADNSLVACDNALSRILTGIGITGRYIIKSIVPYQLSYDYSFNQIPCEPLGSSMVWGSLLLIIALLFIAIRNFRKQPVVSFGILLFFITISLTCNVFMLIGATMADRFLYIPSLGSTMALVFLLFKATARLQEKAWKNNAVIITTIVAVVLGIISINRNMDWKSNDTLFAADVPHAPQSARVHYNHGTSLLNSSDTTNKDEKNAGALQELQTAHEIDSKDFNTISNLGAAYYNTHNYAQAAKYMRLASQLLPNDSMILINLANAYYKIQRWDSAIYFYQVATSRGAYLNTTYSYWGSAWFNLKNYTEAIHIFATGLQKFPTHAELWMNYGNALAMNKQYPEALAAYEKSYNYDARQPMVLYYMALTYKNMGNMQKAEEYNNAYMAKKDSH